MDSIDKCTKCGIGLDKDNYKPRKIIVKKCKTCIKKVKSIDLGGEKKEEKVKKKKTYLVDLEKENEELKNQVRELRIELDNKIF
jgi:hypothetical protein